MAELSLSLPVVGEKDTTAEPKVTTALTEIQTQFNGKISTVNLEAKAVTAAILAAAVSNALLLTRETREAGFEAKAGELAECKKALTVTLPTPTSGSVVGVFNATSAEEVTVKQHAADNINGDFVSSATSVKLTALQHIVLMADGTNWMILAGEPKREQLYLNKSFTKVEAEAGFEPSATRLSFAVVRATEEGMTLKIGGKAVLAPTNGKSISYMVPPGQAIVATTTMELFFLTL